MDRGAWWAIVHEVAESDVTEWRGPFYSTSSLLKVKENAELGEKNECDEFHMDC